MDSTGFQLIPVDVIKAWAKGDYYIGDIPSISYRHLGIALLLRGWYTYVDTSTDPDRKKWAGVAKVDIKGSVLSMGGVRLFGDHAVFWRTEHSYIQNDKEIIWFYSGFNCDHPPPPLLPDIRKKYFEQDASRLDVSQERLGMDPNCWKRLLGSLASDFDEDVERIARARSDEVAERIAQATSGEEKELQKKNLYRDLGMLRFSVDLDPSSLDLTPKERFRKCEYYHYDAGKKEATAGVSLFKKIALEGVA